jgi:3-dehydroquinate synthase
VKTIFIRTGSKVSELRIGESWKNVEKLIPSENIIIITDENINKHYGNSFPNAPVIVIPAGEKSKNFRLVEKISKRILQLEIDRSGFILGIGGGVVCDISGFVASIYLRGIKFGFISTSLLSQVDASVGGKNGINLGGAKNMIGNINQPNFVLCDQVMLKTLPAEEYLSGLSELIKHAIIKDNRLFNLIEGNREKILTRDITVMEELVGQSVQIKSEIVTEDERESGIRRLLNFGHTFGHAIEIKYGYNHGISVAMGMVMASQFSYSRRMITKNDLEKIINILNSFSLLPRSEISGKVINKMLIHDKKRMGDTIHFIMLKSIGNAIVKQVKIDEITEFLINWKGLR